MHHMFDKSPVIIKEQKDHDSWGPMMMFLLFFLVILFVIYRPQNSRSEVAEVNALAPVVAALMNKGTNDCGHTEMIKTQITEGGNTRYNIEHSQREMERLIDNNSDRVEKSIGRVLDGQRDLALDAERQANARMLDDKNDKLAEMRLALLEKDNAIRQQETLNTFNRAACEINNRLTRMEDSMLKRPEFVPFGGTPAVDPCVPGFPIVGR